MDGPPGEKTRVLAQHRTPHTAIRSVDRWLDDDFARELAKCLLPDVQFIPRLRVTTLLGEYSLDLHLRLRGFGVGLICDRSDGDLAYGYDQLWRDAALIGTGAVQVIYRLRHCDIEARLSDILYIVARSDSALFSERGQINLARLASDQARSTRLRQEYVEIRYPADLDDDPSGDPEDTVVASEIAYGDSLQLIRRDRPGLAFWYQYLRNSGARTSQEVMRRFADEHLRTDEEPA